MGAGGHMIFYVLPFETELRIPSQFLSYWSEIIAVRAGEVPT